MPINLAIILTICFSISTLANILASVVLYRKIQKYKKTIKGNRNE